MTKILAEPRRPADNWQEKLGTWIGEVEQIIKQASTWAEQRGWATKVDQKVITEARIGTYEAPTLLVHTPKGRLLLEPVARDIVGADGRLDFCVMPSYDSVALVKTDGTWGFFSNTRKDLVLPWSEQGFEAVALELLKLQ
jgi:hypothetical protein